MNNISNFLMVVSLITMMFSTQISYSAMLDVCIEHCVVNKCLKEVKHATPYICHYACKRRCLQSEKNFHGV
ncbi:hypothetical protein CARUB_v10011919mg [Capsella rubella]|uniref:Plant thionin family protein n=1 Tax=Capsella rubella TaxID=81985 RepID=R0IKP2_9BRAS|nr:hypothetical protein CARUB_v10011919mg [Capsella rubella]